MFCTYETVFFKKLFKHSNNSYSNPKEDIRMQICNGIIQFNSIQNFNYIGRVLYEINAADIKKHPKTLFKLKFKYFGSKVRNW